MNRAEKNKVIFIFTCFCFLFLLVLAKAFKVQLLDAKDLMSRANSQFLRKSIVYPKRGNIYDRHGSPLALNVQTYSIYVNPKVFPTSKELFKKISTIVPELTYKDLMSKVKGRDKFTWLGRKLRLSDQQVEKIKQIKGVFIDGVSERVYPNHEMLSQVIGFMGLDNSGLSGIEYMYDKELKGDPIELRYVVDNKGRKIKYENHYDITTQAKDIYLTIDKEIQGMAEKYLKEAVQKHLADKGGVGIIDSQTGEILAMANYPAFDPNDVKSSPLEHRKLSFVIDPLEPGSAFKLFTVASAFENKIAKLSSTFYCEKGSIVVDGHVISEAESHERYEWLSVADIVRYSSNVGTTKIAFDLKYPKFKETLKSLNFGEKTGIEIPGESRGIMTDAENVSALSLSNMSFGQGIAVTGVQMLAAYAAIANGGDYIRPTIIKRDKSPVREVEIENKEQLKKVRKVFSQETADSLTQSLVGAVEKGTGTNAQIPQFVIAGKTATAQRVAKSGGYSGYVAGFIGFPVNIDKRFVVYVYIENPKLGGYYGNAVAAPVFKKITEYMLYKNRDLKMASTKGSSLENKETIDSVKFKQSTTKELSPFVVPNFIGLDKVSAINIGTKMNLSLGHSGIGVVRNQNPQPGSPLSEGMVVKLEYSPPSYE